MVAGLIMDKTRLVAHSLWPNGLVTYDIDEESFKEHPQVIERLQQAIDQEVNAKLMDLIKFKPLLKCSENEEMPETSNVNDVVIFKFNPIMTKSFVGRKGGKQKIWLTANCSMATILHEIMHTLGFLHAENNNKLWQRYVAISPAQENLACLRTSQRSDGQIQVSD